MRRFMAVVLLLLILGLCTVSGRRGRLLAAIIRTAREDPKHSLSAGGLERDYLLHVPPGGQPGRAVPLVLAFHGGGARAWSMPGLTNLDELADREGFLVAYPDGLDRSWNDGRGMSSAEDVAFVRAVIEDIERTHDVDPRRIYATGISNGGFFSNKLACDLSDKIAAIASVAATMPEKLAAECKPSRAVSVLYIHGTKDPLVPIDGGEVGFRKGRGHGESVSLIDAAHFWRVQDQIGSATPSVETLPERVQDGTHVRRKVWSGGKDGAEVAVYTIEGGGHTWPDGPQYLPKFVVGIASQNLDATATIWKFFQAHPMP
jgi:polyhydroxybutyrate depolymerase